MTLMSEYWSAGGFPDHSLTGIEDLDELEQGFAMPNYLPGQAPVPTTGGGYATAVPTGGGAVTSVFRAAPTILDPTAWSWGGGGAQVPYTGGPAPDAIRQAVDQAVSGVPALGSIPALIGAALNVRNGTGPLPGALGAMTESIYGTPNLPSLAALRSGLAMATPVAPETAMEAYPQLAGSAERIGRAIVRRILGVTNPQLGALRDMVQARAVQVQATAEHRTIMGEEEFKQRVIDRLEAIARRTGANGVGGSSTVRGAWRRY